jgi:4-hydroxythreonine-4-phosphate dehydrogenase
VSRPPRLGITVGDVAGVGPEIIVRALADPAVRSRIEPVVFGPAEVLQRAAKLAEVRLPFHRVPDPSVKPEDGVGCVDSSGVDAAAIQPGTIDPRAGEIAYRAVRSAIDAALEGEIDGIVTGPLNKLALHRAGHDVPGHTEILAEACGVREVAMMLYLAPGPAVAAPHGLGVAHATLHTSVASVPGLLTEERIAATIRLVDGFMRRIGCESPRIGVCALNPHGGEGGLFGNEEQTIIAPAVARTRSGEAIDARGPLPADTLLKRAIGGEFDGVAAMYHDQGHIAIKLVAFHSAVNVTLGLPIIRTSPTQGTAFDIAWKGVANPGGMIAAIGVAATLVRARKK